MKPEDHQAFKSEMEAVASVMRHRTLGQRDVERYWRHLERYDLDEIRNALTKCERELEFFPLPIQIIERIRAVREAVEHPTPRPEIPEEERRYILKGMRELIDQLEQKMKVREDS